MDQFLPEWKDAVPEGMVPELKMLKRTAIQIPSNQQPSPTIRYFPHSALPTEPRLRFRELFGALKHWNLEDITPFIEDIVPPSSTVEEFLLKYARVVHTTLGRQYSSKDL